MLSLVTIVLTMGVLMVMVFWAGVIFGHRDIGAVVVFLGIGGLLGVALWAGMFASHHLYPTDFCEVMGSELVTAETQFVEGARGEVKVRTRYVVECVDSYRMR